MAHLYRLIAFLCFFYPSISFSQSVVWTGTGPAPVGFIDLAGWVKNADGTSTRAFSDGNGTTARVTLTSAPKGITTTSTAVVQTSKGVIGRVKVSHGPAFDGLILVDPTTGVGCANIDLGSAPQPDDNGQWKSTLSTRIWLTSLIALAMTVGFYVAAVMIALQVVEM